MKKFSVLLAAALGLCGAAAARADYSNNFDGATPLAGWVLTGATAISTAHAHSGTQSLYLGYEDAATYQFSPTDQFGKLTIWVYDEGNELTAAQYAADTQADGARWGVANSSGVALTEQIASRSYVSDTNYSFSSIDGPPTSAYYDNWTQGPRTKLNAWNQFVFNRPNASTLEVSLNGGPYVVLSNVGLALGQEDPTWATGGAGFSSLLFSGGGHYDTINDPTLSGVYIDDISFVAVPEPASLVLLGMGAGALLLRRRQRI